MLEFGLNSANERQYMFFMMGPSGYKVPVQLQSGDIAHWEKGSATLLFMRPSATSDGNGGIIHSSGNRSGNKLAFRSYSSPDIMSALDLLAILAGLNGVRKSEPDANSAQFTFF